MQAVQFKFITAAIIGYEVHRVVEYDTKVDILLIYTNYINVQVKLMEKCKNNKCKSRPVLKIMSLM